MTNVRHHGLVAIDVARARGLTLSKYADPTEDARVGLTIEEAEGIAREDAQLIYVEAPPEPADAEYATLGTALPAEMARVRHELMPMYRTIGTSGGVALALMEQALKDATAALAEGDVRAMHMSYKALQGFQE